MTVETSTPVQQSGKGPAAPILHRPWFPGGRTARDRPCDAPCRAAARPFVLAATILASAMAFIDGTVVAIALPRIQEDLQTSFQALQWTVNGYTLPLGALILIGGALGDRLGRRLIFMVGIVVFAVASVLCALAPDAGTLIAGRALQGVGAACLVPQSLAILSASFPKDVRGRAIGLWAGAAAITTAAGPVIGGVFMDLVSWRAVFWINLPMAAVALWLAITYVPESRDAEASGPIDVGGALLLALGLGLATYAFTTLPETGIADPVVLATLVGGAALAAAFVVQERRIKAPLVPFRLFRNQAFTGANGITVLLYAALSGVLFLLPFNLIQLRGYSGIQVGLALLPFGIIMGLLSRRAGRLADRFGPWVPLIIGPSIVCAACTLFALAGTESGFWMAVLAPILLLSVGMTFVVAPLTTAVMNAVPDNEAGVASGINNAASRLSGLIAVALVGALCAAVFADRLLEGLTPLALPEEALAAIIGQADRLAGLEVPGALSGPTHMAVADTVDAAFAVAFRYGMLTAALAAALSVIWAAWLQIKTGRSLPDAA